MNEIDPIFLALLIIMAVGLMIVFTAYPLWIVLHTILCKKLDPILFRQPYFQKSELVNYLAWPLSFLRSLNYVYLIAAPTLAKKKRFKGFNQELPVSPALRVTCKIHLTLMILLAVMFFVFFGYLAVALLFLV